jgi:choline dehydrogenase-like flavoprotein
MLLLAAKWSSLKLGLTSRRRPTCRKTRGLPMHGRGTVRLGPDEDAMAVADVSCRVKGAWDQFVSDASVPPAIPRTKTIAVEKGNRDDD